MFQPLVSIAVITYRSEDFVIETLDSIYNQTYANIELIVSDDGSTDRTIVLCNDWIKCHKERFTRTQVITVEKNTGTSANYNRAERACKGDWVMTIDGDDMLFPYAVEKYVSFVADNPESSYVFARVKAFGDTEKRCHYFENVVFDPAFFRLSSQEQLNCLQFEGNCIPSGTCFFNRRVKEKYGIVNDERIPLLEDWPKWINVLKEGLNFSYLDLPTLKYRLRESSVSTSKPSVDFRKSNALFYRYYQFWPLIKEGRSSYAIIKRMDAEKMIRGRNIFWGSLYKVFLLYRRLKHVEEPLPEFF